MSLPGISVVFPAITNIGFLEGMGIGSAIHRKLEVSSGRGGIAPQGQEFPTLWLILAPHLREAMNCLC